MVAVAQHHPQKEEVLAKAVLRAADQLGLRQDDLAATLGLHRSSIARLKSKLWLDPESKQGELALLLVRLARALSALTGGDPSWIRHFMQAPNQITGGIPLKQIRSVQGLVGVLQFADAMRGKV